MTSKRSYDDACPIACALDFVGERWALLVVRELMFGPKRFTDLRSGLPGVSPNVLTQRLEDLEKADVVMRRKLPPPAATWVYELTEHGKGLEPVLLALARWAIRSVEIPKDGPAHGDTLMFSFRTMFDSKAAADFTTTLEMRFGDDVFQVRVADGQIDISHSPAQQPDAVITSTPEVLADLVYRGRKLPDCLRSGDLTIEGSKSAFAKFITLFSVAAKIPVQA